MALWRSQSIQVVWFLAGSALNVDRFYEDLFGSEPERVERNKLPSHTNPFVGVASGTVNGLNAVVQLQPARVDLTIQPDPNAIEEAFPPTLDSEAALAWLRNLLSTRAEYFPVAIRVAVVANFLKTTATLDESRVEIADLVGLDKRMQSYSDFMFQINRRAVGKQTGVELNRLLRWASVVFQSVTLNLPSYVSVFTPPTNTEQHASTFAVDVNTVLGTQTFQSHQQVSIFNDMLDELTRLGIHRTPLALMID